MIIAIAGFLTVLVILLLMVLEEAYRIPWEFSAVCMALFLSIHANIGRLLQELRGRNNRSTCPHCGIRNQAQERETNG